MGNRILEALEPADYDALRHDLHPVSLKKNAVLEAPGATVKTVHFFETGVAAVMSAGGHGRVAVGLIGCEGASGIPVILGADSTPNSLEVLTDATALSISVPALQKAMASLPRFNRLLLRFCLVFDYQASQTALANATTSVKQRVARWILMAQDRMMADQIHMTHQTIADMVGMRRAGVSEILVDLEEAGGIKTQRASLTVIGRDRLEEIADTSYGMPEKEYRRLVSAKWPLKQ